MTFKKISAALALLLASTTFTACGPEENNETTTDCADGEKKAAIGGADAKCYKTCDTVADCGSGEQCVSAGLCVGSTTTPEDMGTDMPITTDPDMPITTDPDMPGTDPDMPGTDPDMPGTDPDMAPDMPINTDPVNPGAACADDSACMGMDATCIPAAQLPGGYCTSPCQTDANCGDANVCLMTANGNTCIDGCTADADCREAEGYSCQEQAGGKSACLPAPPEYTIGTECADDTACGDGLCATEMQGFSGGYCVGSCENDSSCPENANCVADVFQWTDAAGMELGLGTCLATCTTSADCRADYACADLDDNGVGECFATNTEGEEPGATCAPDAAGMGGLECKGLSGQCLGADNGFGADGYCLSLCDFGGGCIDGAHCTSGVFNIDVCLQDCVMDSDCGTGYTCQDPDNNMAGECLPAVEVADGPGLPGEACASTSDCSGGAEGFCISEAQGFTAGYCTIDCTAVDNCSAGNSCQPLNDTLSLCLDDCMNSSDCRDPGYACLDLAGGGLAVNTPGSCFAIDNCDAATPCDTSSSYCVDSTTGAYAAAGVCLTNPTCTAANPCQAGATCLDPMTGMSATDGICLDVCDAATACREGGECIDLATGMVTAGAGICLPQ